MKHIEITNIKWDGAKGLSLPQCLVILEFNQLFNDEKMEEDIADALSDHFGFCHDGFDWKIKDTGPVDKAVVLQDERFFQKACQRCGSELDDNGRCTDETCPFDSHEQFCPCGWVGHSSRPDVDEFGIQCTCKRR